MRITDAIPLDLNSDTMLEKLMAGRTGFSDTLQFTLDISRDTGAATPGDTIQIWAECSLLYEPRIPERLAHRGAKIAFSLFKGIDRCISVKLAENCLTMPTKSVSGIFFPTETTFHICQLYPRSKCVGRKAADDEDLAHPYGIE
jgi:hypothetical protein